MPGCFGADGSLLPRRRREYVPVGSLSPSMARDLRRSKDPSTPKKPRGCRGHGIRSDWRSWCQKTCDDFVNGCRQGLSLAGVCTLIEFGRTNARFTLCTACCLPRSHSALSRGAPRMVRAQRNNNTLRPRRRWHARLMVARWRQTSILPSAVTGTMSNIGRVAISRRA